MRRMKDTPAQLYEVYDYGSEVDRGISLTLNDFTKIHGEGPCEIDLYIPSILLPMANDDIIGGIKLTLFPCYQGGGDYMTPEERKYPVYLAYQVIEKGYVIKAQGSFINDNVVQIWLSGFEIATGYVDNTNDYIQLFFSRQETNEDAIIMYSVRKMPTSIKRMRDTYR